MAAPVGPRGPRGPQVQGGKIWVRRTFSNGETEEDSQNLEVRAFVTQTATASATMSRTINLGNYESVRIEAGVSLPCYLEEVEEGIAKASEMVGTFVLEQEKEIREFFKGGR